MGRAGLSNSGGKGVSQTRGIQLERAYRLVDRARIWRVDNYFSELRDCNVALSEQSEDHVDQQGRINLSQRKALLPGVRESLARGTPSVEKLVSQRHAGFDFGNDAVRTDNERRRAIAIALLGLAFRRRLSTVGYRHGRARCAAIDRVCRL